MILSSHAGSSAIGAVIHGKTLNCNYVIYTLGASGRRVNSGFYIQFA